jgi:hypothetical protein
MLSGLPVGTLAAVATISTAFGGMIVALIRTWPTLKKIQSEEDNSLRATLLGRIETLEKRIDSMTTLGAAKEELHAAETSALRHRLNGESTSFDALIGLLEGNPNFPPETLKRIADNRARQLEQFNNEMNAITAARISIAATGKPKEG